MTTRAPVRVTCQPVTADAGGLDWQRHPIQPGYLAVLSRRSYLQCLSNAVVRRKRCGLDHTELAASSRSISARVRT